MADYLQGIKIAAYGIGTTLYVTAGALIIGLVIGLIMVTAAVYACAALRRALYDPLQSSFMLC